MNILATNDDGETCPGIRVLARALRRAGHRVLVVAPDRDRSGASHSLSFGCRFELTQCAPDTWSAGGTPVDCVLSVLLTGGLAGSVGITPDIVVSGINAGANLGTDILYSGTAAAARQASLFGIPAIALSLTGGAPYEFEAAAAWSAEHLDELTALWARDVFINVNFPPTKGFFDQSARMEMTFPAFRCYNDTMALEKTAAGALSAFLVGAYVETDAEPGSDWDAVTRGNIAVSRVANHPTIR